MDKNVLNVNYYDTKTKTGGNVQIQQPAGDKLLSQILEAAKPEPSVINIVVEEPKHSPIPGLIKKAIEKKQTVGGFVEPTAAVDMQELWNNRVSPDQLDLSKSAASVRIQEGQQSSCRLSQISNVYSNHSFLDMLAEQTKQDFLKAASLEGMLASEGEAAKKFADASILPNLNRIMSEIQAEKEAEQRAMETEKTFKIKNLDKPLVVLFNGPPRSGKDSACEIIMEHFPEVHYAYFKEVLYEETAKILGLNFTFWARVCQNNNLKDLPMLDLTPGKASGLMTPRDILIYLAEKVLKPQHGVDFIARKTASTIVDLIKLQREQSNEAAVIVVPDLGFDYEIDTFREMLPNAHVISVAIYRPGFTFEGDSRNYVKEANFGLHNTGSYEDLEHKALRLFRNILMDIRPIPKIETM